MICLLTSLKINLNLIIILWELINVLPEKLLKEDITREQLKKCFMYLRLKLFVLDNNLLIRRNQEWRSRIGYIFGRISCSQRQVMEIVMVHKIMRVIFWRFITNSSIIQKELSLFWLNISKEVPYLIFSNSSVPSHKA